MLGLQKAQLNITRQHYSFYKFYWSKVSKYSKYNKKLLWISYLLNDLHVLSQAPVILHCDNQFAELLADHFCYHGRTKHTVIDAHFTRHQVVLGFLQIKQVSAKQQLANFLTKLISITVVQEVQVGPFYGSNLTWVVGE